MSEIDQLFSSLDKVHEHTIYICLVCNKYNDGYINTPITNQVKKVFFTFIHDQKQQHPQAQSAVDGT